MIFIIYLYSFVLILSCEACGKRVKYLYKAPNFGLCGQTDSKLASNGKIINGFEAQSNSWPWMISLRKWGTHYCGGSLISAYFVLTAAHCVYGMQPENITVVVGLHNIYKFNTSQIYEVEKIIIHESFKLDKFTNGYDIALIKLKKSIVISKNVSLICLPSYSEKDSVIGNQIKSIGWGRIDKGFNRQFPENLQETTLRVSNRQIMCINYFFNLDILYCLYDDTSQHSQVCNGDSGGPMFYKKNDKWYIYGLTSFTSNKNQGALIKCRTDAPSFATNVPYFIDWIADKVVTY